MVPQENKTGFYSAILFLVWPFLALVSAFKNHRSSWAKNILWAFIAFYGFSFAIGTESAGTDIEVYINEYQVLHDEPMNLSKATSYFAESGEVDVLRTFIAIVLSRFTDNPSVLTLVYGIIFGFFFSRNMWFVLDRLEGKVKPITILLFTCFFLIIPIWQINGFRFWTAAHVFIYGLLPFLFEEKKGGLFISSLSILVHFSFLVPIILLFTYIFIGNRLVIYFSFFLVTIFLSEVDLAVFNEFVERYAPNIIQERTSSYRGEEFVESYREDTEENKVWYAIWYGKVLNWSVMGFLVLLFLKSRNFFEDHYNWLRWFCFTLLFYGFANLLSSLPSGGRFIAVANLCALSLLILYLQKSDHNLFIKRLIVLTTPALLLFVVVSVRIGLLSMSATTFLGNPILAFFLMGEHLSLNEVLRWVL